MKCPNCGSDQVYPDEGYTTIFRCYSCNFVGNKKDMED